MLVGRRSGWLLASCGIVLLGSTPALPQTPVLSQDACASCDKQLTLTRAEWDCLAQSIDRTMVFRSKLFEQQLRFLEVHWIASDVRGNYITAVASCKNIPFAN